jgi:hypothetical protein
MRLERECGRRLMTRPILGVALAAALCGLLGRPAALAQNAKPKPPGGAPTVTVTVTNSRKTDLVELQAAESGSASWKKVLGGLKAGKQAPAMLPRAFNCRVDLHGAFADGQSMDASDVDVCTQKTFNLTD